LESLLDVLSRFTSGLDSDGDAEQHADTVGKMMEEAARLRGGVVNAVVRAALKRCEEEIACRNPDTEEEAQFKRHQPTFLRRIISKYFK
jgi:hypothetical protein